MNAQANHHALLLIALLPTPPSPRYPTPTALRSPVAPTSTSASHPCCPASHASPQQSLQAPLNLPVFASPFSPPVSLLSYPHCSAFAHRSYLHLCLTPLLPCQSRYTSAVTAGAFETFPFLSLFPPSLPPRCPIDPNSSAFALRSYLYLFLHALVALPVTLFFGNGTGKANAFYTVRLALAVLSAASEASLLVAIATALHNATNAGSASSSSSGTKEDKEKGKEEEKKTKEERAIPAGIGERVGVCGLLLLCFCSGNFLASTTFLPSTFSMYAVTWATSLAIQGRPAAATAAAAAGVLLGWPFAGLAALPLVLHGMITGAFVKVVVSGALTTLLVSGLSLCFDRLYYGQWTSSVLNLVRYNVLGGGDGAGSTLYGVEGPLFYLRNGLNNFSLALPLALLLPLLLLIACLASSPFRRQGRGERRGVESGGNGFVGWKEVVALVLLPVVIWVGFMSLQPHKEERFLYPIYALIPVAAAIAITIVPYIIPTTLQGSPSQPSLLFSAAKWVRPALLGLIIALSYARSTALLRFYSAPMHILEQLPAVDEANEDMVTVCYGMEWHRFPTSFLLPSPLHRAAFIDDGFKGLLPIPFDPEQGGTESAPSYFNDRNQATPEQFLDESLCDYLVELDNSRHVSMTGERGSILEGADALRGHDEDEWEVLASLPFVDAQRSPALYRAFFIPGLSERLVKYGSYALLRRKQAASRMEEPEEDWLKLSGYVEGEGYDDETAEGEKEEVSEGVAEA
ncbi:unnamed protein product [Closterium sp. Naga37s-1]|nr:unnamed protein product [Closterium sp. Naga37s-1]